MTTPSSSISTLVEVDSRNEKIWKGQRPMKLSGFIFVFFVAVMAFPATASAKDLRIGVVNLNEVFENSKKRVEMEESFKDLKTRAEEQLTEKQNSLIGLREEMQLLEKGSTARKELEAELEKKLLYLQLEEEVARRNLGEKEKEYYEELYQDISNAIEAIGKEQKFDLILKKETIETKSADLLELRLKIGIGTVLYYSEALDITGIVVQYLNGKS